MKDVMKKIMNYPAYFGILFLAFSLVACSDDDDDGGARINPTGSFNLEDEYTLSATNSITLESITVGQVSFLVAVESATSTDFIAGPVKLNKNENTNVQLTFDEGAISDDGSGQDVVLKLFADNPTQGTQGSWDANDRPITGTNNLPLTETITVFAEDDGGTAFADFDTNGDGMLDSTEVTGIYANNFEEWDTDDDNMLDQDEFNTTTFSLTDMDDDEGIDSDEWDAGFASFFGKWNEDDFASFDADSSGSLSSDEWNDAFAESEWFGTFDADDNDGVEEDEWDTGLFNDWDADGNDSINEDEFNTFSPFAMNW